MGFRETFEKSPILLMEGAIIERLKRENNVVLDKDLDLAGMIYDKEVVKAMINIFDEYISIAEEHDLPFMMTTPTRRANQERVSRSKYDAELINENVKILKSLKKKRRTDIYIGGLMGCKGDAYKADDVLSIDDAVKFHSWQAKHLLNAGVDYLFAGIMPALSEAIGMAKAMEETELPYIISFMIREDGKLIDGTSIHDAISIIDESTECNPLCYMTNCVHPSILAKALSHSFNKTDTVKNRFKGIQANAACLSPDDLDGSKTLESSTPDSLAAEIKRLFSCIKPKVFGGCCGTTDLHMRRIAEEIKMTIK